MRLANMPKRQEISAKEFEQALGLKPISIIEFDAETFSQASSNGQMIEELNAKAKSVQSFREIALAMSRRKEIRVEKPQAAPSAFAPFLEKLKFKR